MYLFGPNVSLQATLYDTIIQAEKHPIQFVMGNMRTYTIRQFTNQDIERCKLVTQYYQEQHNPLRFYVHAPYVCVLNSSKTNIRHMSTIVLNEIINTIQDLDGKVVIHSGAGDIDYLVDNLNKVNSKYVLVENSANSGSKLKLDEKWQRLNDIWRSIDCKMCLDTAHTFGDGICKFSSKEDVIDLYENIKMITGSYPGLIHLNDSLAPFNSRKDQHAILGQGHIFHSSDGKEALKQIFEYSIYNDIDIVSETASYPLDKKYVKAHIIEYI